MMLKIKHRVFTLRINWFLDFIHRPAFQKLDNTTFRKLDLFPPSHEDGNRCSCRNVVFYSWWYTGQWKKSKNAVILGVMHHRQNPLESTCIYRESNRISSNTLYQNGYTNVIKWGGGGIAENYRPS
jgi:hypothetical protein